MTKGKPGTGPAKRGGGARGPRHGLRGLTCANCRSRKTRCCGTQPRCKTCEVYQDECRYDKPPPMSQMIAMAERLQELEALNLEATRPGSDLNGPLGGGSGSAGHTPRGPMTAPARDRFEQHHPTGSSTTSTSPAAARPDQHPRPRTNGQHQAQQLNGSTRAESLQDGQGTPGEFATDLSLDENGKLCYYGPTSAVHAPPTGQEPSPYSSVAQDHNSTTELRSLLAASALDSRGWEDFALGNAAVQNDMPQRLVSRLVQVHWSWIAPMFMWVYRPAFMRDMATGGPYYSPLLLTVICAHSARFDQADLSSRLVQRARMLLGVEIHKPSSIPTAQALLQLSARELAYGAVSQAWLYSGMAFRMVSDLGLHHSTGKAVPLGNLSAEDVEIRRRLFWGCYFWDKVMSLYLGRMPALRELPASPDPDLLDDSTEHENWSPQPDDSFNLKTGSGRPYSPRKAHLVSCFENSCKLAIIINDIIMTLYSRHGSTPTNQTLSSISTNLSEWRDHSPPHLKYDPDNLPETCPPPHILTQNLLYYTTIILLHRPFLPSRAHRDACLHAAHSIEKLLLLLDQTFGFSRITYLMGYCIYTAASVITIDLRDSGDSMASVHLQLFLRALREGRRSCAILQRSLDIITKALRAGMAPRGQPVAEQQNGANNNDGNGVAAAETNRSNNEGGVIEVDTSGDGSNTRYETAGAESGTSFLGSLQMGQGDESFLPFFPYQSIGPDTGYGPGTGMGEPDLFTLIDHFPESQFAEASVNPNWYMAA